MRIVKKNDIFYCWKVNFNEPIPNWIYKNFEIRFTDSERTSRGYIPARLEINGEKFEAGEYAISNDLKTVKRLNGCDFSVCYEVIENE